MKKFLLAPLLLASLFTHAAYEEVVIDTAKPVNIRAYLMSVSSFSSVSYEGVAPLHVTFASKADIPSNIKAISYDYGDGSSGVDAKHVYTAPGPYRAIMTAKDSLGMTFTAQFWISVNEDPKLCLYNPSTNGPASYAKHYPIGNNLYLTDMHWKGEYIGRIEGKSPKPFRDHVYRIGDQKDTHFGEQEIYEVCQEPKWRFE